MIMILSSFTMRVHLKAIKYYLETFVRKNRGIHSDLFSQVPLNVSETLEIQRGCRSLTDLCCTSSFDKSLRDGYYNISFFFLFKRLLYKNGYTRRSCRRRIVFLVCSLAHLNTLPCTGRSI